MSTSYVALFYAVRAAILLMHTQGLCQLQRGLTGSEINDAGCDSSSKSASMSSIGGGEEQHWSTEKMRSSPKQNYFN